MPNIKNILIFGGVAVALILVYVFFIRTPEGSAPSAITVSDSSNGTLDSSDTNDQNSLLASNFLSLLLNVKNIKLNVSILSDRTFESLHDSSIILEPDGTEGRPNPFAPIGNDGTAPVIPPAKGI